MSIAIHDNPQTTGEPVEGITAGRIVAYWPREDQESKGLKGYGRGGSIPAMIVADWIQTHPDTGAAVPVTIPCCNIRLFGNGHPESLAKLYESIGIGPDGWMGSVRYSHLPARGCFTWIPKA